MIEKLIWMTLIVVLIFESGFWDEMDRLFNKHFPLMHLPKVFTCSLCQTWWLCLLMVICEGQLSLLNIFYCLIMAHMAEPLANLFQGIKDGLIHLIDKITDWLLY